MLDCSKPMEAIMIKRHIGAMIGAFLLSLAHLPLSADDAPPRTLPELEEGKARVFFLRQSSVFQAANQSNWR